MAKKPWDYNEYTNRVKDHAMEDDSLMSTVLAALKEKYPEQDLNALAQMPPEMEQEFIDLILDGADDESYNVASKSMLDDDYEPDQPQPFDTLVEDIKNDSSLTSDQEIEAKLREMGVPGEDIPAILAAVSGSSDDDKTETVADADLDGDGDSDVTVKIKPDEDNLNLKPKPKPKPKEDKPKAGNPLAKLIGSFDRFGI
jgi:hypothetical protein